MTVDPRVTVWAETYNRDGYVGGVPIISEAEAREHRARMEWGKVNSGLPCTTSPRSIRC